MKKEEDQEEENKYEKEDDKERKIKKLSGDTIRKMTAGQVITDIKSAVKELLENALDSGASKIEIDCIDSGFQLIRVSDNGSGILPSDRLSCCLPHHTSKLSPLLLFSSLPSFGFRGEVFILFFSFFFSFVFFF